MYHIFSSISIVSLFSTCDENPRCDDNACVINTGLLGKINANGRYSWQAKNYSQFWGMLLEDGIKYRLGTLYPERSVQNMNEILIEDKIRLPEHFDAREKWPSYIHNVRDQKNCGSSWAFSTTAVSADRLAIQSEGLVNVELSPQQLISCNQHKQRGCKGGYLDRAWWYIHKLGVVSENCYPYKSGHTNYIETCFTTRDMYKNGSISHCPSGDYDVKAYKTTPTYRVSSKVHGIRELSTSQEEDIQTEIFLNGPVQATFLVNEDFYMYSSGVYRHLDLARDLARSFRKSAYHSVRIIGFKVLKSLTPKIFRRFAPDLILQFFGLVYSLWGVDTTTGPPIKYWICDNSWGNDWGEEGFFKIVRGENHCEIESFILAAWVEEHSSSISAKLVAKV
uniref:Peptidase C1A papain C-terminal domain-containing protein n=1 Tax=Romanomermis culicivorax TaxID=13658 RepID=A0A915IFZ3_ROMCU